MDLCSVGEFNMFSVETVFTVIFNNSIFKFETKCCYVLGLILFAGESEVQYNLFLWSIGLVGVITNAWTVILEGNFHLSIVLTMVNTILACCE